MKLEAANTWRVHVGQDNLEELSDYICELVMRDRQDIVVIGHTNVADLYEYLMFTKKIQYHLLCAE